MGSEPSEPSGAEEQDWRLQAELKAEEWATIRTETGVMFSPL